MKRPAIDALLDLCVSEGRIGSDAREDWVRFLEAEPEAATSVLAKTPPNRDRATSNFLANDDNARRAIANLGLGLGREEVL
jgi:hypothetical protein